MRMWIFILGLICSMRLQNTALLSPAMRGDQHGVLTRMIEEIQVWEFQVTENFTHRY